MSANILARTGSVLRHTLRLDRLWLPTWMVSCIIFIVCFVPLLPVLVTNDQMLEFLKETMSSPAVVAMCGMMYGEEYTFGVMYSQMMMLWSALVVCVMNIMLVNRHTRKDEEEGRLELLCSLPIGRAAPLTSLIIVVVAANVVVALLVAISMASFGLESIDFAGSLIFGASVGSIGLVFGALTLLVAQISSTSKSTLGFSLGILFVMYLLRAPADMADDAATNPLGLITPFGLGQRTYPFYENSWWPIHVMILVAVVLALAALALNVRRNHGSGLLPTRSGRRHGGRLLNGQIALGFRLVRSVIIVWALVMLILSISYGLVFNDLYGFYEESPLIRAIMGVSILTGEIFDATINSLTTLMSIIAVIPVVLIVHRLRTEEQRGRLELVFSTASSKISALLGYTVIAMIAALLFQLLTAVGMWTGATIVMDDPVAFEIYVKAALNLLPGVLAFEGLAVLLIGLIPRAIHAIWLYLIYVFYVYYVGGVFAISEIFIRLSPFGFLAKYPAETFEPLPFFTLLGAFVVLSAVGVVAYRARDIKS